MRTAAASVFVVVATLAALLLAASTASAQSSDGTSVVPYDRCDVTPTSRSCVTGHVTVRQTTTPSGVRTFTVTDVGRYEVVDLVTGCVTTGTLHSTDAGKAGPVVEEHVVTRSDDRLRAMTRCGDRTVESRCRFDATIRIMVLPDEVSVSTRIRVDCDAPQGTA